MLYEKKYGPVVASGMISYKTTEPSNMQAHRYRDGESNVPGFVYDDGGKLYVSSNDMECRSEFFDGDMAKISIAGNLCDVNHNRGASYKLEYEFSDSTVVIRFMCDNYDADFVLPLIVHPDDDVRFENGKLTVKNMVVVCNCEIDENSVKRKMFNLTPGFSAIPMRLKPNGRSGEITIKFDLL